MANRTVHSQASGTWAYDANNRLLQRPGTAGPVSYEYDANGNQTKKTEGSKVTQYVYDGDNRLIEVRDSSNNLIARYGYYHHNHLATPMQATDKSGNVVWAASYEPFGRATIITPAATAERPTITSNLRLPGQYEDEETGLHYNWNRYYDAQVGRYVTTDPIGIEGGINLYLYARGNPIGYVDSNGQFVHLIIGGVIGGMSGLIGAMNDLCATNRTLLRGAFSGAFFGALFAAVPIGGTVFAAVGRNALAGAAGNAIGQGIGGGPISGRQVMAQGVVGAIGGGVGNLTAINTGVGLISATSQGVGTTVAIGTGAAINLLMPANAGGLRSSGGGGDNCACSP